MWGLKHAWKWYQRKLTQHPVTTQIVSSGILWSTGDCFAQKVDNSMQNLQKSHLTSAKNTKLDIKRVSSIGAFGACFVGPLGHYWYDGLEKFVKYGLKLKSGGMKFIAAKIILDTLVFGPLHLSAFFTYTGFVSGHSLERIKKDLKRDFLPAFLTEGAIWPGVQLLNFKFVPVKNQLLFVNSVCLLDSAFLSWYKYQHDAPWKTKLNDLFLKVNK